MKKHNSSKWFNPTTHSGWSKTDSQLTRRKKALKAHGGDTLSTARSLLALSNVTKDSSTKKKSLADAKHFFSLHKKSKK
jgi:hypothetical protein